MSGKRMIHDASGPLRDAAQPRHLRTVSSCNRGSGKTSLQRRLMPHPWANEITRTAVRAAENLQGLFSQQLEQGQIEVPRQETETEKEDKLIVPAYANTKRKKSADETVNTVNAAPKNSPRTVFRLPGKVV